MPYFDLLFEKFARNDAAYLAAFGRHVHWGYWPDAELGQVAITPESFHRGAEALAERIVAGARVRDGMRVLDVGCGFGGTVALMNARLSNARLTGLNIDPRQLERAREWVRAREGNTVDFVEGDAGKLPFGDSSFDALTAVECIFHFRSRRRFLREAARVLKPGGWLSISDFVPRGTMLPLLAMSSLLSWRKVEHVYGETHTGVTELGYRLLGWRAGFAHSEFEDVTRNTLPTYELMRVLLTDGDPRDEGVREGTRPVEFMSRTGMLRYLLAQFQK